MTVFAWIALILGVLIAIGALLDIGNDPLTAVFGIAIGGGIALWAWRGIQDDRNQSKD